MKYVKQMGYDIETRSRQGSLLRFFDGVEWVVRYDRQSYEASKRLEWQWILYQNGNWDSQSPFEYKTEQSAYGAGLKKVIERNKGNKKVDGFKAS